MLAMGLFDVVGSFASQRIAREHALHDKRMAAIEARRAWAREDALRLRDERKEAYGVVLVHMNKLMDITHKWLQGSTDDEDWDEIDAAWDQAWEGFQGQVLVTHLVSSGEVRDALDTFDTAFWKWMDSKKVDGKRQRNAWAAFEDAKTAMSVDVKL